MRRTRAFITLGVAVGMVVSSAGPAHATPPSKAVCASAYEQGQRLKRQGSFAAARAQLLVCGRDPCPKVLQAECVTWLEEVDDLAPSVVFDARAADGTDLTRVRVSIDGAPLLDHLDGKAVMVDPGEHAFRFDAEDGAVREERLVIREREKSRMVTARFGASPSDRAIPRDPEKPRRVPAMAYVLGAIGAGSLGAFGYFGLTGLGAQHQLDVCRPGCSPSEIRQARQDYVLADIFLGASVVSLSAALYLVLSRPSAQTTAVLKSARVGFFAGPGVSVGSSF